MSLFGFRRRRLLRKARAGLRDLLGLKVKDIMTDYVVTISPERSVADAASIMIGEDVSALVVEQQSRPIGILTERDFITKVPATAKAFSLKVKDIMSCSFAGGKKAKVCAVEAVGPAAGVAEAAAIMKGKRIRKLVVTSEEGLIAGIVTQSDLSRAIYERVKALPRMERPFLVSDVMTKRIVSAAKNANFSSAKRRMTQAKVSALPVTEKKGYIGIFTEYDVVSQFYDKGGKLEIRGIGEIMKSPVKSIPADVNIFEANMIMLFEKVRRLLVIGKGKAIGIVTQTDIVHACLEYAAQATKRLETGDDLGEEDFVELRKSGSIISEYVDEHLRAYTVR